MSDSTERYAKLASAVFPSARLVRAWRIEGGVSALTSGIELAHGDGRTERLVVRQLSPRGFKDATEQAGAVLEHDVVSALHARGLPVARPRYVDTSCTLLPSPYVIYEFVVGSSANPNSRQMAESMADLLVRLHAVGTENLPAGLPRRDSPLPELRAMPNASTAEDVARRWRGDREPTLLHGDYWPGNVLWRDGEVVALVDWEDVAIGDPLSDLACARVELHCAADESAAQRFTQRYLAQTGMDCRDLVVWDVYVSTAALASMDAWGLSPDMLARRKQRTGSFLAEAQAKL